MIPTSRRSPAAALDQLIASARAVDIAAVKKHLARDGAAEPRYRRRVTAAPQLPLPTIDPALQGHYEGLEDPAVVGYLLGHPRLQRLLLAAIPQVERVFGAEARVVLSTEAEYSGALTLYATVIDDPNLSTEAQIARLDRFDNEWWLAQLDPSAGRLVFDVGDA